MISSTYKGSVPIVLLATLTAVLCVGCGQGPDARSGTQATPAASPVLSIPWSTITPPPQVGPPPGSQKAQSTRLPIRNFKGTGVVQSVNLQEGWFEIDHEEIDGYMPAMRMQWRVREPAMLKAVRVGDKVEFKLQDDNGTEVITELKRAAP